MEEVASLALSDRLITELNVLTFNLQQLSLETSQGTLRSRTLFLATGYRLRELDSNLRQGFESDILYHSGAFKNELRNKSLVVLGGGDSAMLTALDIAELGSDIKVLVRGTKLKARPDVMARVNSEPRIKVLLNTKLEELRGRGHLNSVIVSEQGSEQELPCDKLIVKLGYVPNTELFADQLESDETGQVIVDQNFATSVEGVFAGGDIVRPGYDRIAFALGSGIMAAKAMRKALGHNVSP
jgi:thioredoxin reductase